MRFWERPTKEIVKDIQFDGDGSPVTRVRIRLFVRKGKIENYVVQLEHMTGNCWKQIVRFNYFHGFVHKDFYNADGIQKKVDLGQFPDLKDAVDLAIRDINENYKRYIDKFKGA